jgi:hypothetical protein
MVQEYAEPEWTDVPYRWVLIFQPERAASAVIDVLIVHEHAYACHPPCSP